MSAPTDLESAVLASAARAQEAAHELALATRAAKDAALRTMADALGAHAPRILAANDADVEAARGQGTPDAMVDRLRLDEARIAAMAEGLRQVAGLPDPV